MTLFHTQENIRHDLINADFSISFDLGVIDKNHFRLPYWMEMIDWEHEGITKNVNLRYGRLLSLDRLMQPLGNDFKHRLQKIAFITSHLNEPRKLLYKRLNSLVPIEIVSGRSVLLLSVIHGIPITVVSSVIPPESVITALAY